MWKMPYVTDLMNAVVRVFALLHYPRMSHSKNPELQVINRFATLKSITAEPPMMSTTVGSPKLPSFASPMEDEILTNLVAVPGHHQRLLTDILTSVSLVEEWKAILALYPYLSKEASHTTGTTRRGRFVPSRLVVRFLVKILFTIELNLNLHVKIVLTLGLSLCLQVVM